MSSFNLRAGATLDDAVALAHAEVDVIMSYAVRAARGMKPGGTSHCLKKDILKPLHSRAASRISYGGTASRCISAQPSNPAVFHLKWNRFGQEWEKELVDMVAANAAAGVDSNEDSDSDSDEDSDEDEKDSDSDDGAGAFVMGHEYGLLY